MGFLWVLYVFTPIVQKIHQTQTETLKLLRGVSVRGYVCVSCNGLASLPLPYVALR